MGMSQVGLPIRTKVDPAFRRPLDLSARLHCAPGRPRVVRMPSDWWDSPAVAAFSDNLARLGELTGEDTGHWRGYLDALRTRRQFFIEHGAVASDHGHPTAVTANLAPRECQRLLDGARAGTLSVDEEEQFRG